MIETLLAESGYLPHWNGHKNRLQISIETLAWQIPSEWFGQVYKDILALLVENQLTTDSAKLRLMIFGTSGQIHYLIETSDFPFKKKKKPLNISLARDIAVTIDAHSFMKNNQRAVYEAAAQQALENGCQDMLLCNTTGKIVESTIANVFILRNNQLLTPPLSDGCVRGVFRQGLLSGMIYFQGGGVVEQSLTPDDIKNADAVFLSNALRGMRQVDNLLF